MADEEAPRLGHRRDQNLSPGEPRTSGEEPRERAAARRRRVTPEPAVNAIQATRKPRKNRSAAEPRAAGIAPPTVTEARTQSAAAAVGAAALPHGDSDPWTVPESVRNRFVQDGHRFYFPDGAPAFKDQGRRLTTPSENTQLVHSLIEIAHSRGWTEVTVTGTERFRQEAWRQARIAGLNVRGYRPSEVEHAQLIRALARNRGGSAERGDSMASPSDSPTPSSAPRPDASSRPDAASLGSPRERIVGKLLDHGRDAYRHDPTQDPSYFVRLQTRDGPREVWGKDIERAVAKSLTQPQVGDEVILQRGGRDAVTVQRRARDSEGQLKEKAVEVYRNRWVIEKREFFEQRATAARLVRDEAIGPREGVRQHPELAGTYLNLRAAELAARALRDSEDQKRFVAQVRSALADGIARGEPLQPVRLRERTARASGHAAREEDRAPAR